MYERINNIDIVIEKANEFVISNDRDLYNDFFRVIEEYSANNNILIGGSIGYNLAIGSRRAKKEQDHHVRNNFPYLLYTYDALFHSTALADKLYEANAPHIDKKTIYVETFIKYREFNIYINLRKLVTIYQLDKYRNVMLRDLIFTEKYNGYYYNKPVNIMDSELQLVDIYRKLYTPYVEHEDRETYEDLIIIERELTTSIGARDDKLISGGESVAQQRKKLELAFMDYLRGTQNIIIGDHAIVYWIAASSSNTSALINNPRLQFISAESIEDIVDVIEKIASKLDLVITYITYQVNLPTDFRLLKHTVYVGGDTKSYSPLLDVFNSTQYELIPWKTSQYNLRMAGLYVVLRFKYIDLWSLKLIDELSKKTSKAETDDFAQNKMIEVRAQIGLLRTIVQNTPLESLFQLDDYAGSYLPESLAKKKLNKEERFKKYYPIIKRMHRHASPQ